MNLKSDNSDQRNLWSGKFGNDYIKRSQTIDQVNEYYSKETGMSVDNIFQQFFENLDRDFKILELGCNIGLNLQTLKKMGFSKIYGVEINQIAAKQAQENVPDAKIVNSSIEDFESNEKFDVVYTAGVLIHIHPDTIPKIVKKMIQLSSSMIFGFEYFSEKLEEIPYRGNNQACWKQNFLQRFLDINPNTQIIKKEFFEYKNSDGNKDIAYLLKIK